MHIEESKIHAYLKRIKAPVCPLCGQKDWSISTQVFQAPEYQPAAPSAGGAALPMLPMVCVNCGNTYFINAVVAKLIEPREKQPDAENRDGDANG